MAAMRGGGGSYERGTPVTGFRKVRTGASQSPGGGRFAQGPPCAFSSSLLLSSLELSDTKVYEP